MPFVKVKLANAELDDKGRVVVPADAKTLYLQTESMVRLEEHGDGTAIAFGVNPSDRSLRFYLAAKPKDVAAAIAEAQRSAHHDGDGVCECPKPEAEKPSETNDPPPKQ